MKFTKMHGLGNDYIYINDMEYNYNNYGELARKYSDRHYGIGGDGIITISKSDRADFFMQIYNADGSKGEMCGNGIRCVGKYVYEKGLTDKRELRIDTLAGIKKLELNVVNGLVESVKVNMGMPKLHNGEELRASKVYHNLEIENHKFEVMDISMGNPHTVIFVPEITDELVLHYGPLIEKNAYYKNRTNVEFVRIIDELNIEMRVWERGSGETLACGTGASASVVAHLLKNNLNNEVSVKLLGGTLKVKWDRKENIVYIEGTATKVFEGEI